jgi:hypothetical protein
MIIGTDHARARFPFASFLGFGKPFFSHSLKRFVEIPF